MENSTVSDTLLSRLNAIIEREFPDGLPADFGELPKPHSVEELKKTTWASLNKLTEVDILEIIVGTFEKRVERFKGRK